MSRLQNSFYYKDQSTAYDLVMLKKDYRYCQWTFQNCICLVFLNTHIEETFSLLISVWSGMAHMTLSANRHSKNVHVINYILMDIDSSISLTLTIFPIFHYLVEYFVRALNVFWPQMSRTSCCYIERLLFSSSHIWSPNFRLGMCLPLSQNNLSDFIRYPIVCNYCFFPTSTLYTFCWLFIALPLDFLPLISCSWTILSVFIS